MPAVPPRSPKKNIGPRPSPTSNFPLPVVIDCEKDRKDNKLRAKHSISVHAAETTLFLIDSDFWLNSAIGFQGQNRERKSEE